jgi:uncharacterized protein YybS (DUF2232 family)
MRDSSTMIQRIGIAIGAGLAAALLFALVTKGTLLALLLTCLTPLPIVIATLGWGLEIGALAAAIACIVSVGLITPLSAALCSAAIVAPALALSFLCALPRGGIFPRRLRDGEEAWFPVGGIAAFAALIGSLLGAYDLASFTLDYGSYQKGVDAFVAESAPAFKEAFEGAVTLPSGMSVEDFMAMFARVSPAILATLACLILCANLYAGARAVQLSQRLKRPWPSLPEAFLLPQWLSAGLIACAALSATLRGLPVYFAWIGLGVLGCVYAMQGLAVIHALTRGLPARAPMLAAIYCGCAVVTPLSLPALILVGVAESFLSLRARRAAAANLKP